MSGVPGAVKRAVERWEHGGRRRQPPIAWNRAAWLKALPAHKAALQALPEALGRETVLKAASDAANDETRTAQGFVVSMVWGFGKVGYGPSRVAKMLATERAEEHLAAAAEVLRAQGPLAGYEVLGTEHRIKGLGPAFGTKFLCFQPGGEDALILDRYITEFAEHRCGISWQSTRWSRQTYARYLDAMGEWSQACDIKPSMLEAILFMEQTAGTGGQWDTSTGGGALVDRGDPNEFDHEAVPELEDPDQRGDLEVPPNLMRRILADATHTPEILAVNAVEHLAQRADRDVQLLRGRNPDVTDRQLALHFKRKFSRLARYEGGSTGAAGILGLPVDLVLLAWIQNRLALCIAASYGHDMSDHQALAAELLAIQGVHNSREIARKALNDVAQRTAKRLVLRHLRKQSLVVVKRLFMVVGIKFTRKALVEKGIPLISIPVSAGLNDVSTRALANQAIRYYDTEV